jgi:hypothetical protein
MGRVLNFRPGFFDTDCYICDVKAILLKKEYIPTGRSVTISLKFTLITFALWVCAIPCVCQITSSISKSENITPAVLPEQEAVRKVLDDAGKSFKEGLNTLKKNRRSDSGAAFDKSVEVFLFSTLNIQREQKLQACYSQLIETVYRLEFPSNAQVPQIRSLSATCGWNWTDADMKLADEVVALVKPATTNNAGAASPILPADKTSADVIVGFNERGFEPSPLDELSKLELTTEELRATSATRIVKAQAGDTVAKLATRNGADPIEVGKYNGLLPNSVLGAGREIKIPSNSSNISSSKIILTPLPESAGDHHTVIPIGPKPTQKKDGKVGIVMSYFNQVLHDPYSMRFVGWSLITQSSFGRIPCWQLTVKYRAKNLMGAYVLSERVFCIRNNKIVSTFSLE